MSTHIDQLASDIKSLKVQSATTIAYRSLSAITTEVQSTRSLKHLSDWAITLATARPNEPMTVNIMKYLLQSQSDSVDKFLKKTGLLRHRLRDIDRTITEAGLSLIKSNQVIFTHCHSSKVEHILISAHRAGRRFKVFVDETRPRYQGHITAQNLLTAGLDTTMVVDGLSSYIVSFSDDQPINLVMLGADVIARDGSVLNKIGSYGIALSAHQAKIPVYIATSLMKLDHQYARSNLVPVESRDPAEIWPKAPQGLKILSPAFDAVPAEYITGLVTEFGVIPTKKVKYYALKHYPHIRHNLPH